MQTGKQSVVTANGYYTRYTNNTADTKTEQHSDTQAGQQSVITSNGYYIRQCRVDRDNTQSCSLVSPADTATGFPSRQTSCNTTMLEIWHPNFKASCETYCNDDGGPYSSGTLNTQSYSTTPFGSQHIGMWQRDQDLGTTDTKSSTSMWRALLKQYRCLPARGATAGCAWRSP